MARHEYFLNRSRQICKPGALIVPSTPLYLACDVAQGRYYLGDTDCGSELELFALHFNKRISITDNFARAGSLLGQLWFTPVSGSRHLPTNLVYYLLLTSSMVGSKGTLANFLQQATVALARGYDYREIVWMPRFVRKSFYTSYTLAWEWREPTLEEVKKLDSCVAVIESDADMSKLRGDLALEATTQCIDRLTQHEIEQLARRYHQ